MTPHIVDSRTVSFIDDDDHNKNNTNNSNNSLIVIRPSI